jgi:hypothetical protein
MLTLLGSLCETRQAIFHGSLTSTNQEGADRSVCMPSCARKSMVLGSLKRGR